MPIFNKTDDIGEWLEYKANEEKKEALELPENLRTDNTPFNSAFDRALRRKFPFDYRREATETQAAKKGKAAHEALEKKLKP